MFVECLEAEGVRYVFGIPGEETLDLNDSLAASSVQFVPVRHEQGGAYMADAYGRLTGRAGVCLGTLGPGATNLVTPVADAFLDRLPLVALTGQSDLERMHKESHQYIDLIAVMRPIVKWNARISSPEIVPEVVRKAFAVAESEKPGATHLELPEDVMALTLDAAPLPRHTPVKPEPGLRELERAAEIICSAENPVALAGNGAVRTRAAAALRTFAAQTGIPVAETFMAKGLLDDEDPRALGTVGLQARDYALAGFEEADVVVAIGYDLVEHAPEIWNPRPRQADRGDRHRRRRDRRVLPARGGARRRHPARALAVDRQLRRDALARRLEPPARGRRRRASRRPRRRPLPHDPTAGALGDPRCAGAARTSSSPTWGCTSSGSGACSRPTSLERC